MDAIAAFVDCLASGETTRYVTNPYAGMLPAQTGSAEVPCVDAQCRANLLRYLRIMQQRQPAALLIGEAPGYRGCLRTGIPFTSETIVATHPFFGPTNGFACGADPAQRGSEATATVVWRALDELAWRPLLWNVFPFHPHQPGDRASNRPPTAAEIETGQGYVWALLGILPIRAVVAVGSKAARALDKWGIAAWPVRHPAHGGSTRFRLELGQLLAAGHLPSG